jgi:hypothetical protein
MSNSLEFIAHRVDLLEKQMAAFMADNTTDSTKPNKNSKKEKNSNKHNNSNSHYEPSKKKPLSGYILFSKAERDNVKAQLQTLADTDSKIKSTLVMKHIGELWKNLPDATREHWNTKAKQLPP